MSESCNGSSNSDLLPAPIISKQLILIRVADSRTSQTGSETLNIIALSFVTATEMSNYQYID